MINISKVSKTYITNNREVKALDNLNIELPDNGMVFILGKSGSGKTTLLNMIGGFNKADSGKIHYIAPDRSFDVLELSDNEQESYRNLVLGYVFQDFNLLENCNVEENIKFVLEQQIIEGKEDGYIEDTVRDIIKYVELEGMEKSRISELSGGQIQRVAIARAIVKEPKVILADEPTGNLDYKTSIKIMDILKRISKQCLVVIVTHDESLANMYGDRIINISDGIIIGDENKSDDEKNYRINILDNISGEKISEVFNSKKAAMLYVEKIIFKERKNDVNVLCEEIEKKEANNEFLFKHNEKTGKKLSFKRLFRFAYLNISDFKAKIVINTIVMGILFGIICFTGGIIFSNKIYSETEYITQNRTNIVLRQSKEYEDSFGNVKENIVYNSDDILQTVQTYMNKDNIIECFSAVEIEFGDSCIISDIWIDYEDYTLISGSRPQKENEICITDYMAQLLSMENDCIGSTLYIFDIEFVVTGIIKTDYRELDIINRMNDGQITMKEYDDIQYIYQRCVCNAKVLNYLKRASETLEIYASDFTSKGSTSYMNSNLIFSSISNLSEDDYIIYGREPQSPKEIMVSYEFAVINDMLTEDGYKNDSEWKFIDIYNELYNGAYDNYVNMYDYLNGFTVVGIVGNYEGEYKSDIVIADEVYNDIREMFFQKRKDMLVIQFNGVDKAVLKEMLHACQKNNITIDESVVQKIDGFFEAKDNMWYLISAIMIVFLTIMLMLNVSGIFDNVYLHKKNIGILKALGVKKKSIHRIFYIQVIITVMSIVIIGVASLMIINNIVNVVINAKVETSGVCYVGGEYGYLPIIIFVLLLLNIICVKMSMRKVDSIQTIILLKS